MSIRTTCRTSLCNVLIAILHFLTKLAASSRICDLWGIFLVFVPTQTAQHNSYIVEFSFVMYCFISPPQFCGVEENESSCTLFAFVCLNTPQIMMVTSVSSFKLFFSWDEFDEENKRSVRNHTKMLLLKMT